MEGRFNVMMLMALVVATMLHGSSAQTTHVVGNAMGWIVPPGGEVAYQTWAAAQTFVVGDVLVFNFPTGRHDVAEVTRASFDSCNTTANLTAIIDNGPARINLTTPGEHHYICAFTGHCAGGQKLAINVSMNSASPAPQPSTPPPTVAPRPSTRPPVGAPPQPTTPPPTVAPRPSTRPPVGAPQPSAQPPVSGAAPTPATTPTNHIVGDGLGWTIPPNATFYETWAQGKNFVPGDTLTFNFETGRHDVVEVTKSEYDSCSTTTPTTNTGPATVNLANVGEHYYICTIGQHCTNGQKLAINVTAAASSPPNSLTPSTPSSDTAPPPGSSSAPSVAVAGVPLALLAAAVAFLLN